jgi:hypothetical protein
VPWQVKRSGQFLDIEVLKYPAGLDAIASVVLDANAFPMPADRNARNVVPAGTILALSQTDPTKHVAYTGAGRAEGILAHGVEFLVSATEGQEPAPMFFHSCVFATPAIVGFTTYISAVVAGMPTCRFL